MFSTNVHLKHATPEVAVRVSDDNVCLSLEVVEKCCHPNCSSDHYSGGVNIFFADSEQFSQFLLDAGKALAKADPNFAKVLDDELSDDNHDQELA